MSGAGEGKQGGHLGGKLPRGAVLLCRLAGVCFADSLAGKMSRATPDSIFEMHIN